MRQSGSSSSISEQGSPTVPSRSYEYEFSKTKYSLEPAAKEFIFNQLAKKIFGEHTPSLIIKKKQLLGKMGYEIISSLPARLKDMPNDNLLAFASILEEQYSYASVNLVQSIAFCAAIGDNDISAKNIIAVRDDENEQIIFYPIDHELALHAYCDKDLEFDKSKVTPEFEYYNFDYLLSPEKIISSLHGLQKEYAELMQSGIDGKYLDKVKAVFEKISKISFDSLFEGDAFKDVCFSKQEWQNSELVKALKVEYEAMRKNCAEAISKLKPKNLENASLEVSAKNPAIWQMQG